MKNDNKDVGLYEDGVFALQNMIAAQNHAVNSFNSTGNPDWAEAAKIVREIRSKLLYKLVKEEDSEIYCFSKHILASAMGLKECGDRFMEIGDKKTAFDLYHDADNLEKLFIVLNQKEVK